MKPILSFMICFLFLMACQKEEKSSFSELTSLPALFEDQAAAGLVKTERFEDALSIYVDMLEKEPDKPQIHSNVGVIMSRIQKEEEALKSWQHALKLAEERQDLSTLFAVNFNLGAYYGAKKNIDEALKYYQAALEIAPTSIEAKTNIELLTQSQSQNGDGESQNKDQKDDQKNKDQKDQNQKDKDGKDGQKKQDPKDEKDQQDQKRESSAKYKPRPYQGDQLNEGDVKKILGELRNQEQKIRANFDKKEQKDSDNEKDW